MPGPPKTPTKILEARDTGSLSSRPRRSEPTLSIVRPSAPSWLRPESVSHFDEIVETAFALKVMTNADVLVAGLLAETLTDYVNSRDTVRNEGMIVKGTRRGDSVSVRHPIMPSYAKFQDQLLRLAREFGMTPSARANLAIVGNDEESPLANLLREALEHKRERTA